LIHKRKVITLTGDKKYAFACIGYFSQWRKMPDLKGNIIYSAICFYILNSF
jgi:hypothetical protein